jgi:hypothetical protein
MTVLWDIGQFIGIVFLFVVAFSKAPEGTPQWKQKYKHKK